MIVVSAPKQLAKKKKKQTAEQRMKQNEQERERAAGRASFNRQREFEIARITDEKRDLLRQLTKAHEEKQHFKDLSIRHKVGFFNNALI